MTMLEPSQPSLFNETESELTQSAEASRARTYLLPEQRLVFEAIAHPSGSITPVSFASWDQKSFSWKTAQTSLLEGWTTFSDRFPRSGMMQNGTAYQAPPLVRHISGIGRGYWPTPRANDAEKRGEISSDARDGLPGRRALLADALRTRCEERDYSTVSGEAVIWGDSSDFSEGWLHRNAPEPAVSGLADGFSKGLGAIRAYGNAVVPQIPELIGNAYLESVGWRLNRGSADDTQQLLREPATLGGILT
jgi:hypothetical protein